MRQEITELLDRDPFVPFRIIMTSGQGFDVHNPHLVSLGETVIHVMLQRSDRYSILRLNQVASIEVLEPAQ